MLFLRYSEIIGIGGDLSEPKTLEREAQRERGILRLRIDFKSLHLLVFTIISNSQ